MEKKYNIAIFFDGTWCTEEHPVKFTNVRKLKEFVVESYNGDSLPPTETCTYYEEGPGTRPDTSIFGGGFAFELDHLIYEAYDWLIRKYAYAAERNIFFNIYLFGFSRGAYMAHLFSWLLERGGIPKDVALTYKIAQAFFDKKYDFIDKMRSTKEWDCYRPVVQMLGVWDIVSAPSDVFRNYDNGIPASVVKHIYHAMALDEERFNFPVIKYKGTDSIVTQRWFRGVHSDIGGGYEDDSTLSDITLHWMIDNAANEGLVMMPFDKAEILLPPQITHQEGKLRPRKYLGEEIDDTVWEYINSKEKYKPKAKGFPFDKNSKMRPEQS